MMLCAFLIFYKQVNSTRSTVQADHTGDSRRRTEHTAADRDAAEPKGMLCF